MENSTVNYKKLDVLEKKGQKSTKTLIVVCVLLAICLTLLAAAVLAIGIGVGVSKPEQISESVQVYTLTEEELQGQYNGVNGGINFQSVVNDSHVYLSITTMDNRMIVLIIRPLDMPMAMMEVNETNMLFIEDQQAPEMYAEYLIPGNVMDTMMSIMTGQRNMSNEMLEQLDTDSVNETRQSSLRNLAMSPEANLIIEAAQALGDLGIQGADSQAVMKFYQFAMRLASARNLENIPTSNLDKKVSRSVHNRIKRRTQCPSDRGGDVCNRCPYSAYGNRCFGMCGPECTCWSFVCGDCCVHTFCETHDQCCAERGFYTLACFRVALTKLGSRCSETYSCRSGFF